MMKDTTNGQTNYCPSCEELQRTLIATQAQMSELREALEKIADMAPDEGGHQYVALVALSATADNEQAVNRIKAQALLEAADKLEDYLSHPSDLLRRMADELDGGAR